MMFDLFKKQVSDMWLFVGLGNPGDKYKKNRHNIGFMAVDAIAGEYNFSPFRSKFQGLVSEGRIAGQKVALLKPQTFMNESGRSVKAAAKFFKIDTARILVFHDELDLAPSKLRIKTGGGNAGHNGLKSIQAHMGTPDFVRIRMGIGHPGDKNRVHSYVLKDFSKTEQNWVAPLVNATGRYADLLVQGNEGDFMSKLAMDAQQ